MRKGLYRDLIMLCKPRIILLLVITCAGAMGVATRGNTDLMSWSLAFYACFGLAMSASGANMVNMWYDRDIDKVMNRTKNRPLPSGRMSPATVLGLGIFLGVFSTVFLWFLVNPITALMALSGYLFYVFIYTFWLKRRTVQNIVIGGAAGAFPPLVGWAAVRGDVTALEPWLMFAIIFLWTPPHFWALALKKCGDYTKAGVPMMPVVKGEAETKSQIVYYMLILIPVTLLMAIGKSIGMLYLLTAFVLGAIWLKKAIVLMRSTKKVTPGQFDEAADVFRFSLYYLALLFGVMVLDTFL
ncbi:MAG: heme o synthase [Alphaproteobacteria bacterium]|nr:heme o synthase [Alphaproteobacteria bacterium]